MSVPIVEIPGDRLAHGIGVPLEFMSMEQDVAGLADSPQYAGSMTNFPPEMMHQEAVDSGNVRPEGYLPPEVGLAPIRRMERRQPLLPNMKEAESSPEINQVKEIEAPMPRNTMTDTYGGEDIDAPHRESIGDPVFLQEDHLPKNAGENNGIYSTFVEGSLSDTLDSTLDANLMRRKQLQAPLTPKTNIIQWAINNKMKAAALGVGAFLLYKYVIKPRLGR